MGKKLILKLFLPLLIFFVASYSVFWYVKSGEIQKNITNILKSNPKSSVGKVTATGFPLSHKIEIENITLRFDNKISEEEMVFEKIITQAKAFSDDFSAVIVGDIKLITSGKKVNTIKFSQVPSIYFSVKGYRISKVSYVDDGYKILDDQGNTIFYAGSSKLDLGINKKGGYDSAQIKANFSNISSFDIFTMGEIIEVAKKKEEKVEEVKDGEVLTADTQDPNAEKVLPLEIPEPIADEEENVKEEKITTNRNLKVELEIVYKVRNDIIELKDISISDIEIFSPLFKINSTGFINDISQQDQRTNIVIKVKNIDNVLIYVRKFISSLIPADLEVQDSSEPSIATKEDLMIKAIPEEVITGLIIELAGRNPDSNEQVSEFKTQGSGSNIVINDMPLPEVWNRLEAVREFIITSFVGDEDFSQMPEESVENEDLGQIEDAQKTDSNTQAESVDTALPDELPSAIE